VTDEVAAATADTVAAARVLVAASHRIVVLTGAGISTESGISDFRGPDGVWTRNPEAEKLATLSHYVSDPDVRRRAWESRLRSPTWEAVPNDGHRAVAALGRRGRVALLVTQNVDGLHQAAGSDPEQVVEIHGTMRAVACLECGDRNPMDTVLDRVRHGEADPRCQAPGPDGPCDGILKSATISFGQSLVAADLARAEEAAAHCDLLLAVGSTLSVYPAAGLVPLAARAGAAVVIVIGSATEYDDVADVVVRDRIGTVLPTIVAVD
jgi:NAD-dependent deacetylase